MGERKTGFNLMLGRVDRDRLRSLAEGREVPRGEVIRTLIREAFSREEYRERVVRHGRESEGKAAEGAAEEAAS